MPVQRVRSHPNVRYNAGRIALQRGPVVYCLEEADNGADLNSLVIPRNAKLSVQRDPRLLGGIVTINGKAKRESTDGWRGTLYQQAGHKAQSTAFTAIPYCVWCNREPGEMLVWVREGE
jgi:DUF1680 family protein